jgi:hypothetical protein
MEAPIDESAKRERSFLVEMKDVTTKHNQSNETILNQTNVEHGNMRGVHDEARWLMLVQL